jgi:VRR-NUC domain
MTSRSLGDNEPVTSSGPTIVEAPSELRDLWRQENSPLPARWRKQYPQLFDDDDLRHAQGRQPLGHFCEWVTAIHLYERDGSRSLVEKYDTFSNHFHNHRRKGHRRKVAEYERVVPQDQREALHEICSEFRVQLPDLLVIASDGSSFSFVEVKGPGDRLSVKNADSHEKIGELLGVPVEIVKVVLR